MRTAIKFKDSIDAYIEKQNIDQTQLIQFQYIPDFVQQEVIGVYDKMISDGVNFQATNSGVEKKATSDADADADAAQANFKILRGNITNFLKTEAPTTAIKSLKNLGCRIETVTNNTTSLQLSSIQGAVKRLIDMLAQCQERICLPTFDQRISLGEGQVTESKLLTPSQVNAVIKVFDDRHAYRPIAESRLHRPTNETKQSIRGNLQTVLRDKTNLTLMLKRMVNISASYGPPNESDIFWFQGETACEAAIRKVESLVSPHLLLEITAHPPERVPASQSPSVMSDAHPEVPYPETPLIIRAILTEEDLSLLDGFEFESSTP